MRKKILVIPITLLLIVSLTIPVWGVASQTKFKTQQYLNMTIDTFPYPTGAVIEIYKADTNRVILYNFAPNQAYVIGGINKLGSVIGEHNPYTWGNTSRTFGTNTIYIQSTQPIYRCAGYTTSSSLSDWVTVTTKTPTVHSQVILGQKPDGTWGYIETGTQYQLFETQFTSVVGGITSTTPPCYQTTSSVEPQYYGTNDFVLAPYFDSSTLNNEQLLSQLTSIWDEIQVVHTDLTSLRSDLSTELYGRIRSILSNTDSLVNDTNAIRTYCGSLLSTLTYLRNDFNSYYAYFSNDYQNNLDNWFYNIEVKIDAVISELQKLTTNSGESGGKVIDDGVSNAKQKAKDETPDPADEIDESQFSLQSLLGGFNWVKTQIENFFNITHVDEFIEIVLFIALAGWVIGKKLNKG